MLCGCTGEGDERLDSLYGLSKVEEWWRDQHSLLNDHGYELRPRFRPGWIPSWKGSRKDPVLCEDSHRIQHPSIIDAIRISDKKKVAIKKLKMHSSELAIARFLTSENMLRDPRNHTVPILDVFENEDESLVFMVMPLLSAIENPLFSSVNEVLDFMKQTLEGLSFMHEHGVAHRDCSYLNIMMDGSPLFPRGFHPGAPFFDYSGNRLANARKRRDIRGGVRYYFADFGISSCFENPNIPHLVIGRDCQDKELPEIYRKGPYDPFPVDVFLLGNVFRRVFIEQYEELVFLAPLTEAMTKDDAKARPAVNKCIQLLEDLIQQQPERVLLRLLTWKEFGRAKRLICSFGSFKRELAFVTRRFISRFWNR